MVFSYNPAVGAVQSHCAAADSRSKPRRPWQQPNSPFIPSLQQARQMPSTLLIFLGENWSHSDGGSSRLLSIFLSQGLVFIFYWLQLGSRKEKATWILSSTMCLEGRLSRLQPTFSPQGDVDRQKELHSWYCFPGGYGSANAAGWVTASYLPRGKILQLMVNRV